jgi:cytochrome c oxidase cbb3-type subunit 2
MAQKAGPPEPWTDPVVRGRKVYLAYGCVSCHTQQIRGDERRKTKLPDGTMVVQVIPPDRRYGLDEASRAEDYASDDPPFLGTERTGPDLSTVGTRLPSVLCTSTPRAPSRPTA